MPHASVKLLPGVNTTDTPALNQAGISQTQLVRFVPDQANAGIVQKIGGWSKFYANTTPAVVRALWAWEDTSTFRHLAYGTQTASTSAQLGVITNGAALDITPRYAYDFPTPAASTTAGSSYVVVTDIVTTNVTRYDTVYIVTPMSVGGLVLFGQYPCDPDGYISGTSFTVQATDVLGSPLAATSTSTTVALPFFSVTSGVTTATVTFPNHGYAVGDTFPVNVITNIGGANFYGNQTVQSVIDANNFTIVCRNTPTATATGYLNGGLAAFIFGYGVGSVPTGTGYGIGGYGAGGYGTGVSVTPATGTAIDATDWTLDNWGSILLSCPIRSSYPYYQPIYQWNPDSSSPTATVIANAPVYSDGMFVAMPQRQVVAWGTTFNGVPDPLLIRWCDVGNYDAWIGTVVNQAGSYRLPKGSKIVGCIQGPQQALVWTDLGVWSMQYVGQPYVYSFNEIGSGCGMIARKAAAAINGAVYWMGPSQFFSLTADGVNPVVCPVWDVIFQDLDQDNVSKIRVAVNSRFGEITWYYPTLSSGGEVNAYVKYNTLLHAWDFGTLGRSAWVDQSVLGPPIGADPNTNYLYQHETSPDADGQPITSSFRSGYFAMNEGDDITFVDQVWPDMKWGYYAGSQNATVNITFYVTNYPGDTPRSYGPYAVTQNTKFISPRFRGRLVSVELSSSDIGSFWRLGNIRYRLEPDGKF